MPTAADKLTIENLRRLAADVRGAGETITQGQQQATGVELQRQQQEQLRQQRLQDIQQQQQFQAGQAELGREFQAGQQTQRLEAQALRGPGTKIDIQLQQQNRQEDQVQRIQDLATAGVLKTDEAGQVTETDIESLARADTQGKLLTQRILSLREQKGEFNPEDENTVVNNIIRQAREAGVKSPGLAQLKPRKGETRESYLKRLVGFRDSLIKREVAARIKKEDFTKAISSVSLGGTQFRKATAAEESQQRARVLPRIQREVLEEFGGEIQ